MVSGLSYSHTVVSISIRDLEHQVLDYKHALEKEFHTDHLQGIYNQIVQNLTNPKHPLVGNSDKFHRTVFKVWAVIGAIHMAEVDDLYNRIALLYELLPKTETTQDERVKNEFHRPSEPDSEWIASGHPKERIYEKNFGHPLKKPTRPKRMVTGLVLGTAALMFGGSGTLFGWLGMRGSSRLYDNVMALNKRVDQVVQVQSEFLKSFEELSRMVEDSLIKTAIHDQYEPSILLARLRTYVLQLENRITKHERLVQQLQHRRLSVDFLEERSLQLLFNGAKRRAQAIGFHLLLERPSELFQLEASHFFNGDVLSVVLHIPIAPEDSLMRLFRLHPFPLPFANNTFLIPNVRNDILAVSNSNFRYTSQMSMTDLLGCQRINKLYFCERSGVLHKHPEDSCLGALYNQKFDLAKKICTFNIEPAREYIHQLMDNWFLLHTMEPLTVPVLCSNNTHLEWHIRPGVTRQHLGAGCIADFPRHRLLSDVSVLMPQDYVQFDMDWDPVSFLSEYQAVILPEFRKLERLGATSSTLATPSPDTS